MSFKDAIDIVGKVLDAAGVILMIGGVLIAALFAVGRIRSEGLSDDAYRHFRQSLGRAILLSLELLVAADIIRTVAVSPTFRSAGVLAIVVLIRTFLSVSLEVELEGRWPWQKAVVANPGTDLSEQPR
jgi:uncharacterized membrane protein